MFDNCLTTQREAFLQNTWPNAPFLAPSNYTDIYHQTILPNWGNGKWDANEKEFMQLFGCPNGENDQIVECRDPFARFFNSLNWYCNTRNYWSQADFEAFNYGKVYAFVNEIADCDDMTKAGFHAVTSAKMPGQAWAFRLGPGRLCSLIFPHRAHSKKGRHNQRWIFQKSHPTINIPTPVILNPMGFSGKSLGSQSQNIPGQMSLKKSYKVSYYTWNKS